jgi:ABC-2 type transport system permease protein
LQAQDWYVLWAIVRKEWRIFSRYPLNALLRIADPLIWLTPVYFMSLSFSVNGRAPGFEAFTGTHNFLAFILLGNIVGSYISAVLWNMGFSLKQEMEQGTLESLWLTPNSPWLHLIGRSTVSVLVTGLNTLGVWLAAYLLFGFEITSALGPALLVLIPMVIALYGFGIAYAGIVLYLRDAVTLSDIGTYTLQILSGINFPVTALPRPLMIVGLTLPMTYAIDAIRALLIGTTPLVAIEVSLAIVLISMFVFLILGRVVFERIDTRVRKMGTLSTH